MEAIPGYRIDRKISSGGTSGVYRAIDVEAERHVALKILFPRWAREPEALDLFHREAYLLKTLQHPHVVRGLASGHWRGLHWLAMEWVPGETALDLVQRAGPLSPTGVLELGRQLGESVNYLWSKGIVHGDIKPANILLESGKVAKLCDFGFAQQVNKPIGGTPFGTPAYASPEQCDGVPDLDVRADLYSLGATLYHMATGEMPPAADPWGAPPVMNRPVPPLLQWVVRTLMAPSREDRYTSPAALLKDLAQVTRLRRRVKPSERRPARVEFHWEFN